jgi:hypothetical protein
VNHYDTIRTFLAKLDLWIRRVQQGNAASFSKLDSALEEAGNEFEGDLQREVEEHLQHLKGEFQRYFPDLNETEGWSWRLMRDPFRIKEDLVPDDLQEEFLEMKHNSSAADDFDAMSLSDYWTKYVRVYPNVAEVALRVILPFSTSYLCESGFSTLVTLKTKQRNKLDVENDLRCALSATKPRIPLLVSKKQLHPSH